MKLISHRGNISGPKLDVENKFEYIINAINAGFDVEIDLRFVDNNWWLGHDHPQYQISLQDLIPYKNYLWCHCKNFEALENFQNTDFNYFWHQEDDHTITSKGHIWTYPGKEIGHTNIIVMPELVMPLEKIKTLNCYAICSDMVGLL
jgi:hypothetical protein